MAQEPTEQSDRQPLPNNLDSSEKPASSTAPDDSIERAETLTIDELPELLGFTESSEMIDARMAWLEAITNGAENARELGLNYQVLAESADAEHTSSYQLGREQIFSLMMRNPGTNDESDEVVLAEAASLGFTETQEMRELRARIRVTIAQEPAEQEASLLVKQIADYQIMGDRLESAFDDKIQIGLLLTKAMVWRDAGKPEFYEEDIADIITYVEGAAVTGGDEFTHIIDILTEG